MLWLGTMEINGWVNACFENGLGETSTILIHSVKLQHRAKALQTFFQYCRKAAEWCWSGTSVSGFNWVRYRSRTYHLWEHFSPQLYLRQVWEEGNIHRIKHYYWQQVPEVSGYSLSVSAVPVKGSQHTENHASVLTQQWGRLLMYSNILINPYFLCVIYAAKLGNRRWNSKDRNAQWVTLRNNGNGEFSLWRT